MSVFEGVYRETQTAGDEPPSWEDAVARGSKPDPFAALAVAIQRAEAFLETYDLRLARIEDRLGEVVAALDRVVERLAAASCAREDETTALGSLALDDAERAADMASGAKPVIEWYARGGGVARMGPFPSMAEAASALRLADGPALSGCLPRPRYPDDAFVWPEVKP